MILKDDGWYKTDKNGSLYQVAPPIQISKKKINMETKENFIVIDDGYGNEHEDTMEILNTKNFESLTKYGFAINPRNKNDLLNELVAQTTKCAPEYLYSSVGLVIKDEQLIFQGHELIMDDISTTGKLDPDSNYDLKPTGTLEKWLQMYKVHVKDTTKLELAVVLGVSGVVFRYLAAQSIDLLNPIIHFSGDSSTGKTTAAQLALSVAGNPRKGKGQFNTWNNTENAFQATIQDNFGIPMLFDEISTYRGHNISQLIYQLAEGNPRGRANIEGKLRKQPDAATVIFSTGETNVTEHNTNSNNTGVGVRILEFDGVVTESAEQAAAIKNCIFDNYGHVLPLVARELIESDPTDMVEIFQEEHDYFVKALNGTSNVVERVANYYAAIVTTANAFNQSLVNAKHATSDLVNLNDLRNLLVVHEQQTADERDIAKEFYSVLLMHLIQQQHLIADKKNGYGRSRETIGYYEYTDTRARVKGSSEEVKGFNIKILKSVFDQVMNDNNFEGHKKIQKSLSDKGYIVKSSEGRIAGQETVSVEGKSVRKPFYTIKVSEEYQEAFNNTETISDNPNMRLVGNHSDDNNEVNNIFTENQETTEDTDDIDKALENL